MAIGINAPNFDRAAQAARAATTVVGGGDGASGIAATGSTHVPTTGGELLPRGIAGAADGVRAADLPGANGVRDASDASRRVLVFMTDNTGGHLAMAKALKQQIETEYPKSVVEIANGYDKTVYDQPQIRAIMRKGVMWEREAVPLKLEIAFARRQLAAAVRMEREFKATVFMPPIDHHVKRFQPDVIVSTHESTTAALDRRRHQGRLQVPVVAALIDSAPHGLWLGGSVDNHLIYNPNDLPRLDKVFTARRGETLRADSARPPVNPKMYEQHDRTETLESFGLPTDRPVVLASGGSLGTPIPADLDALVGANSGAHIAVATGRNEALFAELTSKFPKERLTPIGYTDRMPALLSAVDGVMLNSNGATSYEAAAAGTPIIFARPVPGWGTASAKALEGDGLATYARSSSDQVRAVQMIADGAQAPRDQAAAFQGLFDPSRRSFADEIMAQQLAH